jgi:hypothetical protein
MKLFVLHELAIKTGIGRGANSNSGWNARGAKKKALAQELQLNNEIWHVAIMEG